jgi:beta-lactamase superfamily II metal-dependent hydrolase
MLDIDFISRSDKGAATSSSYDAIALRFKEDQDESQKVVVIDGGFSETGTDLLDFIQDRYQADKIDLMISTHPDTDHLNGLVSIIQQMPVSELLIHQPRLYRADLDDFKNIDNLDSPFKRLITVADEI